MKNPDRHHCVNRTMDRRSSQLKRLEKESFDVLIIGSGINDAVAAAALSTQGGKTTLIDRGDFDGFTSQSSSNLIWGGIKYLESFEIGLVRQLCCASNQLTRAYPSSIREIRFFTNLRQGVPISNLHKLSWDTSLLGFRPLFYPSSTHTI